MNTGNQKRYNTDDSWGSEEEEDQKEEDRT